MEETKNTDQTAEPTQKEAPAPVLPKGVDFEKYKEPSFTIEESIFLARILESLTFKPGQRQSFIRCDDTLNKLYVSLGLKE
jgi:hypothetical protein